MGRQKALYLEWCRFCRAAGLVIVLLIALLGLFFICAMFALANIPAGIFLAIFVYIVVMFIWAGTHNVTRSKKED